MAVARLGGTVEGRPTGTRNFLQRIDELVAKEAKIADMEALLRDRHSGRYKDGHLWNCPRSLTGADCYCGFEEFCKCVDALLAEGLW